MQFNLDMCVATRNRKNYETVYFEGSRSFKVIVVDNRKKLVTSACHDEQHVCAYLQPFSRYSLDEPIAVN